MRQHHQKFAEERKHTNVDNIDEAAVWPLDVQFNPSADFQDSDYFDSVMPTAGADQSAQPINRFDYSDQQQLNQDLQISQFSEETKHEQRLPE